MRERCRHSNQCSQKTKSFNEPKVKSNEQKVTRNKQKATSNEQKVSSNKKKVTSNEQKVKSNNQKVTSNEQKLELVIHKRKIIFSRFWNHIIFKPSKEKIIIKNFFLCELGPKVTSEPKYAWNIFAALLHEKGPWELTKGNTQLIRENNFSLT